MKYHKRLLFTGVAIIVFDSATSLAYIPSVHSQFERVRDLDLTITRLELAQAEVGHNDQISSAETPGVEQGGGHNDQISNYEGPSPGVGGGHNDQISTHEGPTVTQGSDESDFIATQDSTGWDGSTDQGDGGSRPVNFFDMFFKKKK